MKIKQVNICEMPLKQCLEAKLFGGHVVGKKREKGRQTKKQTLNCREQTDGYKREGG